MMSFAGGAEQQQAFDEIKEYLSKPPVLVPPQQDRPFYVYLSVGDTSIASVLVQKHDGQERVVFYLSRRMLDAETRYLEIEKRCLCLFFTCTKLRHILLLAEIIVMQIGCHKAHAVGSCPEMLAWKMDVCIVRVRYSISACESSQRAGTGGSCCRQDQH